MKRIWRSCGESRTRRSDAARMKNGNNDTIEAIKKLDALLEYAVMHGDEKEAERIREELRKLADEV